MKILIFTTLSLAVGLAQANTDQILERLQSIGRKATHTHLNNLSPSDSRQILQGLERVEKILDGERPPDRPHPHPGRRGDRFTAICHVDDDPQFDWDQIVIGQLTGDSVAGIRRDCQELAKARYGSNGSSNIKDIQPILQERHSDRFSAICHVDDDPQFDWDQIVIGKITGESVQQLVTDCAEIAEARYGANGSSNIKDTQPIVKQRPGDRFQGICHVDDDPQFDWDQIVIGKLTAPAISDITEDCAAIAKARYGANGSSNVKDIGPIN